jgi:hypothetical protein
VSTPERQADPSAVPGSRVPGGGQGGQGGQAFSQLSAEQVRELEATLANFVSNVKASGRLPVEGLAARMMAEHNSHTSA